MNVGRIVSLSLVLATSSPVIEAQVTYRSYGAGLRSCKTWSSDRQQPSAHLINLSWVLGFLSGAASSAREIQETDFPRVEMWMDQYCEKNPLSTIAKAATGLVEELSLK